jgi:hypothetical protein
MDMMLDDHKKDVKDFEKAADKCKDADLKNFATNHFTCFEKTSGFSPGNSK